MIRYNTDKIKRARMERGWNQTELAFRSKMRVNGKLRPLSVTTVSLLESGKRSTPKAMKAMCDALDLDIAKLVIEDKRTA